MTPTDERRQYAEDTALLFEQLGLSRTAGRIFGWLLISDPPEQSMNDLVEALGVSKSSVSTASRTLLQAGLVQRISVPGARRDVYRVPDDIWQATLQHQAGQVAALRGLAARGLGLLAGQPPELRRRLQEMENFYAFLEKELPLLLARWEAARKHQNEGALHA